MAHSIVGNFVSLLIEKLAESNPEALKVLIKGAVEGDLVCELFNSQSYIGMALGACDINDINPEIGTQLGWINTTLADIGRSILLARDQFALEARRNAAALEGRLE